MAQQFVGKWNLIESDNFDAYMKQPLLEISVEGDHWKLHSQSTFKNVLTEFDLGKEFEETTADGRVLKSTFTFEDGKLIQVQKKIKDGDKDSRFVRYIEGDKLIMEMESEGVKAKRVYERAQ
ncbi:unnamed protein product [Bursaphelenchus xylophilus]|uniref:(pine wood nematode) hypothetical protein n=1 Tax=Bursaphelenchus xylophilus TaxID=6326 RepID=A0A7I8XKJ3_BURXY|nr:unnamed protein product [Bursaphelenchus xylophilus]CAG9120506.1 unnamed protein product [Bursaphelenchus xylophilus]